VLATVLGALVFSERVPPTKCFGVLAVVLGIILLHLGERPAPNQPPEPAAESAGAPTN
jgi:drug/metabolite transporter (DMT)-like permease